MSVGSSYLATNIFDGGTTHFIKAGAVKMAEMIVGEVRKNKRPARRVPEVNRGWNRDDRFRADHHGATAVVELRWM